MLESHRDLPVPHRKNMKQIRRTRDFECYDLRIRLKQQASMSTEECTKARCTVHPIIGSSGALFPTKEKVVGRARRGWDHELPIFITLSLAFLQLCWPKSQFRSNGFHIDFTRIPSIKKLHVSPMATGCFAVLHLQSCLWITLNMFLLERKRLNESDKKHPKPRPKKWKRFSETPLRLRGRVTLT